MRIYSCVGSFIFEAAALLPPRNAGFFSRSLVLFFHHVYATALMFVALRCLCHNDGDASHKLPSAGCGYMTCSDCVRVRMRVCVR